MYRRIEIIHEGMINEKEDGSRLVFPLFKGGICGTTTEEVSTNTR